MTDEIKVPIDRESDEDRRAEVANHLIASFDGATYTLRFYQVLPPVELALDTEAVRSLKGVKGRHITTLAVSAASMPAITQVLQDVLRRQLKTDNEDAS